MCIYPLSLLLLNNPGLLNMAKLNFYLLAMVNIFIFPNVQVVTEEANLDYSQKLMGKFITSEYFPSLPNFSLKRLGLSAYFLINFCYSFL